MREHASSRALSAFLRQVRVRVLLRGALLGAAAGLSAALVVAAALWFTRGNGGDAFRLGAMLAALVAAACGALAGAARMRDAGSAHRLAERAVPRSRNLLTTAAELLGRERSGANAGAVDAAVLDDAASLVSGVSPAAVQPLARPAAAAAAVVIAWVLALGAFTSSPAALPALLPGAVAEPRITSVDVEVIPPSWIGGEATTLPDPERVAALAGSRLRITVRASAATQVWLEKVAGAVAMEPAGPGRFAAELRVDGDDFVALEPRAADGAAGRRRMFGIGSVRDEVPRVTIAAPGRDLVLPRADSVLQLQVEAEDDHALASLTLRYTRVTGFGEQFTFVDGEVPLEITRQAAGRWVARARWPLAELELERGDMVVYRAIATDRQPGGGVGESDTFMVEIGNANVAAAGGFSVEEDPDRYALSQQMVVVLTERLMARRESMSADEFAAEASTLAAAQRRVRAEFVFMLGGELGDESDHDHDPNDPTHVHDEMERLHEEAHARADLDVLEGRMGSQGRGELVRAIQAMSHAATLLSDVRMDEALRAEQTALVFLQRAFSRSRYILRAFTERERIDLERRLTGSLATASAHRRDARHEALDAAVVSLRSVLSEVASPRADAAALARAVLAVDAGDARLQEVAALFADAAAASSAGRRDDADARMADGVGMLSAYVREQMRAVPVAAPAGLQRLEGALVDALRSGGAR